jgi:hypothetical protein
MKIEMGVLNNLTQADRFYCHAEPKGEASGFSKRKTIFSPARFFASLRFAQNDKAIYVFANKRLINNNVSKSVSLSNLTKCEISNHQP